MRIYLLGYMASGKTTFGKLIAERLGFSFLDIDQVFEERYRISITDFFSKYDESAFRRIEHTLLLETTQMHETVISTGGGTPCFSGNMQIMKDSGLTVYVRWDVAELAARLRIARKRRPLMKDVAPEQMEEKIRSHLALREPFYLQADIIFHAVPMPAEKLADRLVKTLRSSGRIV